MSIVTYLNIHAFIVFFGIEHGMILIFPDVLRMGVCHKNDMWSV